MSAVLAHSPTIGDNNPPLADRLAIDHAGLLAEVEALAARANTAPKKITDDASAEAVAKVRKDATAFFKNVDMIRTEEKEPHLQAGRTVDDFFRPMLDRSKKMREFFIGVEDDLAREVAAEERRRRDEEARKAREEAARQREIADRQAAAARPVAAAKAEDKAAAAEVRAERLETAPFVPETAKAEWAFCIVDVEKIDLNALRAFIGQDVVEKAIRQHMRIHKGSRPIAGVEFFEDFKAKRR